MERLEFDGNMLKKMKRRIDGESINLDELAKEMQCGRREILAALRRTRVLW